MSIDHCSHQSNREVIHTRQLSFARASPILEMNYSGAAQDFAKATAGFLTNDQRSASRRDYVALPASSVLTLGVIHCASCQSSRFSACARHPKLLLASWVRLATLPAFTAPVL
jgi:hypothetical protein